MDTATRTSLTTDSDHGLARLDRWTYDTTQQRTGHGYGHSDFIH